MTAHPPTKKHILVVLTNFYPHVGGLERYSEELFSRLAAEGDTVTVLSLEKEHEREEMYRGMRIIRLRPLFKVGDVFSVPHPGDWLKFKRQAKKLSVTHISVQTRFFYTSFLGLKLARSLGVPCIHTEHGSDFVQHSSKLVAGVSRWYDLTLGRYVLKNATAITAVSKDVAKFVERLSGRTDTHVIHNSVDSTFWDASLREDAQQTKTIERLLESKRGVFFMGRLLRAKGWLELLNAVKELDAHQQAGIQVLLAGTGPDEGLLKETIQAYGLSSCVHYMGRLTPEMVRIVLRSCVYVNPSYSAEGLQTTLLEAAAMESWIITTQSSGVSEVVTSAAGEIIPKQNVTKLKEALERILTGARKHGSARQHILANFSWEVAVKHYQELLQSL